MFAYIYRIYRIEHRFGDESWMDFVFFSNM